MSNLIFFKKTAVLLSCCLCLLANSPTQLLGQKRLEIYENGKFAGKSWQVSQNPNGGKLLIDLSPFAGGWAKVAIYDVSGQLMGRQLIENVHETVYDFSEMYESWSDGLYFVEMLAANGERNMTRWTLKR